MAADNGANPGKPVEAAKERLAGEKEVEAQEYYHGFRPRNDVVPMLTEIGDFLVRTSNVGHNMFFVLSVKVEHVEKKKKMSKDKTDETKVDGGATEGGGGGQKESGRQEGKKKNEKDELGCSHLRFRLVDDRWSLFIATKNGSPPSFPTIFELIEYYRYNPIMGKLRLGRPIAKPMWHIKHTTVTFDKKDILGSGNFCDVYKGFYQKTPLEKIVVAIKAWHEKSKAEMEEDMKKAPADKEREAMDSKAARESMISEGQLLSYYKHRHVVLLYGVCCDHLPVLIVMEYCAGGNLENHLKKQGPKISTPERLLYCLEAAKGMRYLHSKGCIHRDLAARNCLISNGGCIKITDFGLSQMMKPEAELDQLNDTSAAKKKQSESEMKAQVPIRWMAPESLRKENRTYSAKTDVWSYGILCYEIFNNGETPWPDEDGWDGEQRRIHMKKIATWIRNCKMMPMPTSTPSTLKDFIEKKIWAKEPVDRPEMTAVCKAVHAIFLETPLPPAAELTINTLTDVNRKTECLEDTLEAPPEETGDDQGTVFVKEQASGRRSSNRKKNIPTPTKETPTKQEISQREIKKTSTKPPNAPPAERKNAMAVIVVDDEEKKTTPIERKKTARPRNKEKGKETMEEKSSRPGDRHKKKNKPKSKSVRRKRVDSKQLISSADDSPAPL